MPKTRYQDLKVAVSFSTDRRSTQSTTHTFDITRRPLPLTLDVDGGLMKLKVTIEKQEAQAKPKTTTKGGRTISVRRQQSLEITLPPGTGRSKTGNPYWKDYNLVPTITDTRGFFPPYGVKFHVDDGSLRISTHITCANNGDKRKLRGGYFTSEVKKIFDNYPSLKPGDKLLFKKDGTVNEGGADVQIYKMWVIPRV
jgi:hypothetical protein